MGNLLISVFLLFNGFGNDQHSWFKGTIVTNEGEVMVGELAVLHDHETLLMKKDKGHHVIPAFKIASFRFYDDQKNINRKYKVIANKRNRGIQYSFYEIVTHGKVEVLRKKNNFRSNEIYDIQKTNNLSIRDKAILREVLGHDYFLYKDGELTLIDNLDNDKLLSVLSNNHSKLRQFIDDNNLRVENLGHCVQVVSYYNKMDDMISSNVPVRKY